MVGGWGGEFGGRRLEGKACDRDGHATFEGVVLNSD